MQTAIARHLACPRAAILIASLMLLPSCAHEARLDSVLSGRPFWYRQHFLHDVYRSGPEGGCGEERSKARGELVARDATGCHALATLVDYWGIEWPKDDRGLSLVTGPCVGLFTTAPDEHLLLRETSTPGLWAAWRTKPESQGFEPVYAGLPDFLVVRDEQRLRGDPRLVPAATLRAKSEGGQREMWKACGG